MPVLILILLAAIAVWGLVYARYGSILVGCALLLCVGYVFGHTFWHVKVGPLTVTLDRLIWLALCGLFAWKWYRGQLPTKPWTGTDWIVFLFYGYITVRAVMTPEAPEGVRSGVPAFWRLVACFWMPAVLYWMARGAACYERTWKAMLTALVVLGGYLTFTAFAEIGQQWWAVFPRYISDPTLGTHFGRARGPALMSASLGVFLTACFWAAWFLWPRVGRKIQLGLAALMGAMVLAVYFTYTRSTWLGLAGSLAVVPLLQFRREWRNLLLVAGAIVGLMGAVTLSGKVMDLDRQDTDGHADHSVYQRESFAIVSWRMFRDAPLVGHGFSRFYDLKMPYLADRSQQIELESLRDLDHHNTLLSLLTETGLIGFALLIALLVASGRAAWYLIRHCEHGSWHRTQGLFSLAVLIDYLATALFHDLTLSPTEQWLLLVVTGVTVGLQSSLRCQQATQKKTSGTQDEPTPVWSPATT